MDIQYLDRQYVAGLGIRHRDGAGERVEAVPVKSVDDVYGGVWPYLSVRDLAGVVDDRVSRLDREHRFLLVVPDVVDPIFRKVMCLRHAANLLLSSLSSNILSQFAATLSSEMALLQAVRSRQVGGPLPYSLRVANRDLGQASRRVQAERRGEQTQDTRGSSVLSDSAPSPPISTRTRAASSA